MREKLSVKGCLFSIAIGMFSGMVVLSLAMFLAAFAAVKLEIGLRFYDMLLFFPLCLSGFLSGWVVCCAADKFGGSQMFSVGGSALIFGTTFLLLTVSDFSLTGVLHAASSAVSVWIGGMAKASGAGRPAVKAGKRHHIKPGRVRERIYPHG